MKIILTAFVIVLCISCGSNHSSYRQGVYISVENETSDHIDSILVYARTLPDRIEKLHLAPHSKKKFYLDMYGMSNGDGSWRIEYKFRRSNKNKGSSFGYYTGGYVQENWIELKIDTSGVKEIHH